MKASKTQRTLDKICELLDQLNNKLNQLIEIYKKAVQSSKMEKVGKSEFTFKSENNVLDVMTLLSLPDHLRKTALAVCKLGKASAQDVARETKRARAGESSYLNQLVSLGYLKKERKGHVVYYRVERD
jgi:hypothetical protein